jgi:EmrB/QacA subfamily drug resistance transporter
MNKVIAILQPCDEGVIGARTSTSACTRSSQRWILIGTILASSMVFIDGTVINVALPALQANLGATVVDVQWVIESYALLLAALLLIGGSLGDHYGRRRIFVAGIVLFGVGSACCGLSANVRQLIIARGFQGLGAALLVPGSLAIISASFPNAERGRAIGTWSGATAITAAIGPVLGGWLIEHISWRAIFYINLPIALVVLAISLRHVPESRDETEKGTLDWLGGFLTVIGLGSVVYGLLESSRVGFEHVPVLVALCLGTLLLVLFVIWEARIPNPMLPLTLFRSRDFTGANLLTFFLYSALSGTMFFLPMNLIQIHRYTPIAAGAALLPFILMMFVLSRWAGGLVPRYGAKIPLVIGPAISAISFALLMIPGADGNFWNTFFPAILTLGFGMAISVAPLTTTVMSSVPENRVGIASGINNAVSRVAALVAIAVLGIVMVQSFNQALDQTVKGMTLAPPVRTVLKESQTKLAGVMWPLEMDSQTRLRLTKIINDSFVSAFRRVMMFNGALALAGSLSALLLISSRRRRD